MGFDKNNIPRRSTVMPFYTTSPTDAASYPILLGHYPGSTSYVLRCFDLIVICEAQLSFYI